MLGNLANNTEESSLERLPSNKESYLHTQN